MTTPLYLFMKISTCLILTYYTRVRRFSFVVLTYILNFWANFSLFLLRAFKWKIRPSSRCLPCSLLKGSNYIRQLLLLFLRQFILSGSFCLFINSVLLGPIPLSWKVLLKIDKIFDILILLLGISSCMRTSGKIVQRSNRDLIADDFALCSVLTCPSTNSRAELVILTPRLPSILLHEV